MDDYTRSSRYDYFLIWGHGKPYQDEIINIIREEEFLDILRIEDYSPNDLEKFIREIYSLDYIPLRHLRSKTDYLRSRPKDVTFVFVRNRNTQEFYSDNWDYLHIEDSYINSVKNRIRNIYNPKNSGKRTEEHVVHASDNEYQVNHILKYLGHDEGLDLFRQKASQIIDVPYYLNYLNGYKISNINISDLGARILIGGENDSESSQTNVFKTPHFKALCGHHESYTEYIDEHIGGKITKDHRLESFLEMASGFEYLEEPYSNSFIVVEDSHHKDFKYAITDGVHRSAILAKNDVEHFPVVIRPTNE